MPNCSQTLKSLRDKGNTVIVVEHDEETIRAADTIVDVGPLAGQFGGKIIVQGTIQDLIDSPEFDHWGVSFREGKRSQSRKRRKGRKLSED